MQIKTALAAVALLALGTAAPAAAQTGATGADDPVVATIDGEPVHRSDLQAIRQGLPQQYQQLPLEMIYDVLLDRAVDFRLLLNEAERRDLGEDPEVQPALEQARADVLRNALVQRTIAEETSEGKLRERYETMRESEDFAKEEVHARHILVESEAEAREIIAELEAGADFADLAEAHSTGPSAASGGDLGFFSREQMVPAFAEAAFAMEPGEVSSEPVETQFGWHVIKVLDRRTAEPEFAEAAPELRQEVAREAVMELVERLRTDAEIERFNLDGSPRTEAETAPEETAPEEPAPEEPAQ